MSIQTVASLAVPVAFVSMWFLEARRPARELEAVPRWTAIGIAGFASSALVGSLVPLAWGATGLLSTPLVDLSTIGAWGIPIGALLVSFTTYWWHRAQHRFDVLWRTTHQLHHSALRVDIAGAYLSHPFEVVAKSSLTALVTVGVLGLAPWAASIVSTLFALLSLFQHWNIGTPRWLGWIVARPEMHLLHHERDVHARNYGELPIWDALFGTFVNPLDTYRGPLGFGKTASARWLDMLLARDVGHG